MNAINEHDNDDDDVYSDANKKLYCRSEKKLRDANVYCVSLLLILR